MNSQERINIIKARLTQALHPTHLDVIDDSHKHQGHPGAKGGAGHYTVIIQADLLKNKSRLEAHREIYQHLNDLMPHEIHALIIKII